MKKNFRKGIMLFLVMVCITFSIQYYNYSQTMSNVKIVQYFDSRANNLEYQTIYIRAVVPKSFYISNRTMNAIRIYAIIRSKNIPNRIDIVLYDNIENLRDGKDYAKTSLKK